MRVAVLGSGSRGNAVALEADGFAVLVDAGFGIRTLQRRARAAAIDLRTVRAVLLTHEHSDHARGASPLAQQVSCPIYASPGTLAALAPRLADVRTRELPVNGTAEIGPFTVSTCPTSHDAVEPLALAVTQTCSGERVGIAYDLGRPTSGVRRLLRDCTCLIIEANHDDLLLRTGPYPPVVRERIAGPGGHLSNRAAVELVEELCHQRLHTVVLAHLSDHCNRIDLARRAVRNALRRQGFRGRLLVAEQETPLASFEVAAEQYSFDAFG